MYMNSKKKFVHYLLIDGTSYLYRSYYSFSILSNKNNTPSGAIYGVIKTLKALYRTYPKSQIIIIFDSPTKNFRHILFQPYKAHRPKMPTNLKLQINPLYEIIKAMGFPIITIPYFEADDIIGTLSHEANKEKKFTLICTNDKDLAQLVNVNVNILENKSNKILGEQEIKHKYGVIPTLIPDLLGLMGDKSDNIPGVPTIGKKTALTLLKHFRSLEDIYDHINEISQCSFKRAKHVTEMLIIHKKLAFLSKKLATIKTDVIINKSINEIKMSKPSIYKLVNFFKYYKFHHWSKLLKEGTW